jgi:serine/threonine protein kinase
MLRAGERIGDWIIEGPLGEGGMGAVYRVHSALTERLVAALKVMKPTAEPDARARFVREAEALSALRHPAVVRVMGFMEDAPRGVLCLIMELALGETLRQRLARGAMDLPEAMATFVPLAQGLDHAHASGIFHRDLKPANVILTVDGTPRLVDFGIAAALHAEPLTDTGQLGTLPYLPPEVFRGQQADPAAIDVYAFGLLLHEALTGQRAFAVDAASTPAAAAAAIGVRKLQVPSLELPARFPERVRDLVRRATDADAGVRPTMRELRTELESAVERRSVGDVAERYVPVAPPPATVAEVDRTTRVPDPTDVPLAGSLAEAVGITGSRGVGRRRGDRTRVRLLAAVAIGAVFFALGVLVFARRGGNEPVQAGSSPPSSSASRRPTMPRRLASPAAPAERLVASPAADVRPETSRPTPEPSIPSPTPRPATPEPAAPASASAADPLARQERPVPSAPRAPPPEPADEGGDDGAEEEDSTVPAEPVHLEGRWEMEHQVEATTYEPYLGMRLGYVVNLRQDGDRVYGQGRKVSENGTALPPGQRTPIEVAGRIEGGQLVLRFTEIGANRTSRGTIRWTLTAENGAFAGRFASDAANSRGRSSGHRIP